MFYLKLKGLALFSDIGNKRSITRSPHHCNKVRKTKKSYKDWKGRKKYVSLFTDSCMHRKILRIYNKLLDLVKLKMLLTIRTI